MIRTVLIENITIPGGNRETIDEAETAGLAQTIAKRGLISPIVVRPVGYGAATSANGHFELIAGERRLRAAIRLKWREIEASVQDLGDDEAAELRLIENTQRVPLTAWEEADQVLGLNASLSIEEVGLRLGRSPAWVAIRRAIGKLVPELKALVREQDWPMGHLPLLARIPADHQPAILASIVAQQQVLWCDWTGGEKTPVAPTCRELAELLDDCQRLLSTAPWKLSDAGLLPRAGACNVCPKRSSVQVLLFPEMEDAKEDRCLDEGCWQAKQAALVTLNVAKLRDKGEEPIILKSFEPVSEEATQALGPVVPANWNDYAEVKKGTPGAVPAVVVSGGETGTVKYVRPIAQSNGSDKSRPVNQETGEREEPTAEERMATLKLKRQCKAAELWAEKLPAIKVAFKGVLDALLIFFGSNEKRAIRNERDWSQWNEYKPQLTVDAWAQLCPVFQERMRRFGPASHGEDLWREAMSQAKALSAKHVLDQCWKDAVAEVSLPKVLRKQGVKDQTAVPK